MKMSNNIHVHIPASKDTLFMRGFNYRQDIEHIREFFSRECGGRNTVEFFKDDGNDQLFLALRFESKDVAKEVMHRFNDTEILGDRITMTWYKDLRRTRQPYTTDNYRRPAYRSNYDNYNDYRDRNMYNSRSGNYKPSSSSRYAETSQQVASRTRRYTRSSSHSRSSSVSRSMSASRSRSRSSSHSYDSRENKKKQSASKSSKTKEMDTNDGEASDSNEFQSETAMMNTTSSLTKQKSQISSLKSGLQKKQSTISATVKAFQDDKSASKSSKTKELDTNDGEASDSNEFQSETAMMNTTSSLTKQKSQISSLKSSVVQKKQSTGSAAVKAFQDDKADVESDDNDKTKGVLSGANAVTLNKQKKSSDVEDSNHVLNIPTPAVAVPQRNKVFEEDGEERAPRKRREEYTSATATEFENDTNKRTKYDDGKLRKRQEATIQRGMVGMSSDKILLIKQKKEEIEKAYRQDCETFATVTKLLISKDADLEDKIQMSLRENLKDIGQRCIQELREFVERVKNDDEI